GVLRPQALDKLVRDERQHLDEGHVGRAATPGVFSTVDWVDSRPDEQGIPPELATGDRELPRRVDERPEPPRAGDPELQLDPVDDDRLINHVVLELDPDAA